MAGENRDKHAKYVASQASNAPDYASGFEFHTSPVLRIDKGRPADRENEAYRAITLFLLEGSSDVKRTSVTVKAKGRELSVTASQSGKTRIDGASSSARRTRMVSSMVGVNSNEATVMRKAVIGRIR